MNDVLKKLASPFYYLLIDKFSFDENTSHIKKIKFTWGYRLASKGIFISKNERKIAALKNKHAGKRCFIIGNGPSLNKLDLEKLKDEITFGVNAIYLNYDKMKFHPTYYVVEDNLVAEDRYKEINEYHGPQMKLFGAYLNHLINEGTDTAFINIRRNYADTKNFPLFSKDATRFLGVGGSVTYVCLQLAYYMGFNEVYMIGFDHSYVIPKSAEISNQTGTGFDILSTEDDPNHFAPSYFGKGYRWHDPNVERMEVGFRMAKSQYEVSGRKIYNATFGGHLEVFERKNFNDIF